ncbi:MAG: ROK family protein [Actinomycetota bacterium]
MSNCYLAIDVGSTRLAAAIVDDGGEVLVRDRVPTPAREVWPALARLVGRVLAAAPEAPGSVGVGCSGPMDLQARTVSPLHIPNWVAFPLAAEVESLTQLPTVVDHSAKAVALAEAWKGAARGWRDFATVVIGAGVSGAVVSGGRLLDGQHGNAGQIGHIVVEPDGRTCRCGGKGCLEAYCGGRAIEEETGRPPQRAPQVIVERTGTFTGRALASLAAVCDLRHAVVAGSVALAFGDVFLAAARSELEQRARLSFTQGFEVQPAALGQVAPLVGAAAFAKRATHQ